MELFLCDFLVSMVLGYERFFARYCENCTRELRLKDIYSNNFNIVEYARENMMNDNYHKIDNVKRIYKKALGVNIGDTTNISKHIETRHNLVHRNGHDPKKFEYKNISDDLILELIKEVDDMVNVIIDRRKCEIEKWYDIK